MKTRTTALSVLSLAVVFATFALSVDAYGGDSPPAGIKMCLGCHGEEGVSEKDTVPTIAGMSAFVHADYLYAYREGARICSDRKTKAMCSMTYKLTDDQIEAMAEYFAGMQFKAAAQEFDADKAALGAAIHDDKCDKCHTDGGSNPDDDASILAGQWLPYLQQSLMQFVNAEREQPEAMQRKTTDLSEADVQALAHFYASQQ